MIYISANTANQTCLMTLKEGREFYQVAFTDYLLILEHSEGTNTLNQVAEVLTETDRYTRLNITTVPLTITGQYNYYVYGQNSDTNLDPNDESVVGLVERGILILTDNQGYFDERIVTIPETIIYNNE